MFIVLTEVKIGMSVTEHQIMMDTESILSVLPVNVKEYSAPCSLITYELPSADGTEMQKYRVIINKSVDELRNKLKHTEFAKFDQIEKVDLECKVAEKRAIMLKISRINLFEESNVNKTYTDIWFKGEENLRTIYTVAHSIIQCYDILNPRF